MDWHYIGHYGQLGPLTREQVDELIDGGVITRETYVWKAGMSSWHQAGSVPELSSAFRASDPYLSPPPPPTPTATVAPPQPATHFSDFNSPYGSHYSLTSTAHNHSVAMLKSDRSRVLAGLLNLIPPGGIGRMYLGYAAYGVIQMLLTIVTCGFLYLWSLIDGILMLAGNLKYDGYGRVLDE